MDFEIHKKFRFDCGFSQEEHKNAQDIYLAHLASMDLSKAPNILEYFGLSFFHDSEIFRMAIDTERRSMEMTISRGDDKKDLDDFRIENNLTDLSWEEYIRDPFVYLCVFENIEAIQSKILDFDELQIVDTEIALDSSKNSFLIRFSFSEIEELSVSCGNVHIIPPHIDLIKKYTNNLADKVPYCKICENKLMTFERLRGISTK